MDCGDAIQLDLPNVISLLTFFSTISPSCSLTTMALVLPSWAALPWSCGMEGVVGERTELAVLFSGILHSAG